MKRFLSCLLVILLLASCAKQPIEYGEPLPEPSPSVETPSPSTEPSPEPPSPSPIQVEEYIGPLYHAFFHFLIAYPEIAYTSAYGKNLDRDCVTPSEFRRSLEEFYRNDFILMNLNDYLDVAEDGTVTRKPIMVPVGKKPLILSFDDINYYSGNHGHGVCDKVVLDKDGKLAMLTIAKDGSELITYDNDVIPILEAFCEEHPDFSPFGDKGLLSITGYDGILGYRTQSESPNRQSEIEAVKPVVEALLDAGWYFGSHSYSHFHMNNVSLARVKTDTEKWRDEVGSLVGDTSIYLFPYGERPGWDEDKYTYLIGAGFPLLMGVGFSRADDPPYVKHKDNYYFFMDRWFIDGVSLRNYHERLTPLLDAETVYCPEERNDQPRTAPVSTGAVYRNADSVYRDRYAVTVALGGDVMLAGTLGGLLKKHGSDAVISPELAEVFRNADIAMVNLESAVSTLGKPWPEKLYTFRAEPFVLDFLRDDLGVDVVSVANNHTVDYGYDAFLDTLERLDGHGIGYTGGGKNLTEAAKPYVVDAGGVSVAFLAAISFSRTYWSAQADSPGLLFAYDPALLLEAVEEARELYDYVIVYMHWGLEYENEPTSAQVSLARKLIDAGADAVIGSHSHCIQSFEMYNGKPIAYSLGNFLMRNYNDNTAVVLLHLLDGRVDMEIIPVGTEGGVYNDFAGTKQASRLREFWQSISPSAVIGEDWRLRGSGL
ncbi:MAG: CapA family protein [Oscillospiraceae bacterium]|nr:CapA family protein [Oscillospiraceae bacterium]